MKPLLLALILLPTIAGAQPLSAWEVHKFQAQEQIIPDTNAQYRENIQDQYIQSETVKNYAEAGALRDFSKNYGSLINSFEGSWLMQRQGEKPSVSCVQIGGVTVCD